MRKLFKKSEIPIESQGILEFLLPVSFQAVCTTTCNLRMTPSLFSPSRLLWKGSCYCPQQLSGIGSKLWGTASSGQDNYTAEVICRYQLCFPVTIVLVLRLAGVKGGGCCPMVNARGGRKPQHPTCKLKTTGMCYLGRTPISCLQKVSSCLAPRSYPNERQTPRSCRGVF